MLPTFNKWGVFNIIGFKTTEKEETKFVNFVWHKICAKYENHVLYHNVCSTTKDTVETFVTGTSIVKNSTKASFSLKQFSNMHYQDIKGDVFFSVQEIY